jgi:glycosyltransferase involved in cell wall biosynthesis
MNMELVRHSLLRLRLWGGLDQAVVPRLSASRIASSSHPTAWFICPDYNRPSGGNRKLYHCVDILNDAGLNAAIIHTKPGFRLGWFENRTRVVSARRVVVRPRDIIVMGEIYGRTIRGLPRNVRQVIFNQNIYNTLRTLTGGSAYSAPYIDNPDLALVLVVSQDNAEVLEYTFPGIPVRRLHLGIDPGLYHLPLGPKQRRIGYMPRKRRDDAADVLALLRVRGVLDGWDVMPIDDRSEAEAAELLRTAKIFLSFSRREGFGLPPVEALACGCLVVGYHGFGGREYFRSPFAIAVEDGDIAGFARSVESAILHVNNDQDAAIMNAASRFAFERYPIETEKRDLLNIFGPLLER